MKKQNNITLWVKNMFYTLLAIGCCTSCADSFVEDSSSTVKEGVPVNIDLQFKTSTPEKVATRGLTDAAEFQVNNLYLLIFNAQGERKAGSQFYADTNSDLSATSGTQAQPTTGTIKNIKTTSGKSYIYAIANAKGNELDRKGDLKNQLDAVSSLSELKAIVTNLSGDGVVARSTAYLLMSGAFKSNNTSETEEGLCTIPTSSGTLSGSLKLRRADSHITFKINLGENILDAEFESWQVFNVPTQSYLVDQKTQYAKAEYKNSSVQGTFTKETDVVSFDFYMQENLKNSITARDGSKLTSYKDREKEYKNTDGTNTGEYMYVEPGATFVEIKAKLNIRPKGDNLFRTADVKYTIHLGGGATTYTNFNSERNAKYTYNVTINDVESIIVEVTKGEDEDNARPGAEGSVVDATVNAITLDSHYNCFNIGFTKNDIEDFSFIIESPFAPQAVYSEKGKIGSFVNTTREDGDYKWIQFQRTSKVNTLAAYKTGKVLSIYDLVNDMKTRITDDKTYYYTVFINEYYYDQAPTTATQASWKTPLWRNFVNQEDRKLLLFLGTEYSGDKESSYSKAKYLIRQRSIQTYYSTEVLNSTETALGMEHTNETGAPDFKWNETIFSNSNGFINTFKYFGSFNNKSWSNYVEYSTSESFPYTYNMRDVAAIAECLSRNRDEDGDGKIDKDEMKWYLPATDQLVSMFLGAKSLPSPMFDDSAVLNPANDYNDGRNHYLTSDKQKLWAEEGSSFGGLGDETKFGDRPYPKNLRCVRNLGLSNTDAVYNTADEVFTYNKNNRVFVMDQLTAKNKRDNKITEHLTAHNNFSDDNRPYKAFQMAKNFTTRKKASFWSQLFDDKYSTSDCKGYTEGSEGNWRSPNQRELMIMYLQNKSNVYTIESGNAYGVYTSTEWKYDKSRHFGFYGSSNLFLDNKDTKTFDRTIRCVRDVDADAFGYIIK